MSRPVIVVVCGLLAFYTLLGVLLVRRERRRPLERDRIICEARERAAAAREVDDLELLYNLPAYNPAAAIDDGPNELFEQLGPPPASDPAWEAGLERLWDAARDEQNGDPT